MKLEYGKYIIDAEPARTAELYASLPPCLSRCACPACQNFLKAARAHAAELEAALAPLGIDPQNPWEISVLFAEGEILTYRAVYGAYGRRVRAPKLYDVQTNELGTINVIRPSAFWEISPALKLDFQRGARGELAVRLTARLPWVMQTLSCFYSGPVRRVEKSPMSRAARVRAAAEKIARAVKK